MICAKCGKLFNGGHAKHKQAVDKQKISVAFCTEECQKMYR